MISAIFVPVAVDYSDLPRACGDGCFHFAPHVAGLNHISFFMFWTREYNRHCGYTFFRLRSVNWSSALSCR
ncbi:MAG: hypothetical protein ING70_12860 [Rhodocyclaceae bacterium]|nr:hypothetical protein [Rhodocyclaceae bacterium]MCA3146537.1 hypothetical protein [Rhodocyclaceae bacterium]